MLMKRIALNLKKKKLRMKSKRLDLSTGHYKTIDKLTLTLTGQNYGNRLLYEKGLK